MFVKAVVTVLLVAITVHCAFGQWVNDYDGVLDFECPLGQTISRVQVCTLGHSILSADEKVGDVNNRIIFSVL